MAKVEVDTIYLLALQEIQRAAGHISDAFELSTAGDDYQFDGSMNLVEDLKDAVAAAGIKVFALGHGDDYPEDDGRYEPRRNGVT